MSMSSVELISNAQRIRSKLRQPSNAVLDRGIDLKRLPRGFVLAADRKPLGKYIILIKAEQQQQQPIPVVLIPQPRLVTIQRCIRIVAEYFDQGVPDLLGQSRLRKFVLPRHVAAYLSRHVLQKSFPQIGRALGGRDHTTAMSSCSRIARIMRIDADLSFDIAHIELLLIEEMGAVR